MDDKLSLKKDGHHTIFHQVQLKCEYDLITGSLLDLTQFMKSTVEMKEEEKTC